MNHGVASPLSRRDIRQFAYSIRSSMQLADEPYFPIVQFLEFVLPKIYPGFSYEIASKEEMGNLHGLTRPKENLILIREDVYEGACMGNGRDRFTLAHELAHFLIHTPDNVSFARSSGEKIPAYRDPEWQANTFAAELLIPAHLMRDRSIEQIASECGVSISAARVQKNKM